MNAWGIAHDDKFCYARPHLARRMDGDGGSGGAPWPYCLSYWAWPAKAGFRILNFALLYVMLSLGLNIVVGFAGLLDLGYIAFYAVGAYTWALLASPHFNLHLPFWAILPLCVGLACLFGVLLGAPTLRLRGDYLAIVTLGFGEIIRVFLNNLNAPINITNGPQGVNRIDPFRVGGFAFNRTETLFGIRFTGPEKYYYLLLLLTLLIMFVVPAPAELAHRPRVGGDTGRRSRGQGHGHQHTQHQAAGLCHGGILWRGGGRAVRVHARLVGPEASA